MNMIGYARISTLDQNETLQLDALKAAGCEKIFVDKASGADRERPQLAACLAYLREGETLCFWKIDRLARSVVHLGQLAEECERRGVGLKCLTQPIDTTSSAGRLMFSVLGAFAEFERDIIRERTLAGLAVARAAGRIGGRPRKHPKAEVVA